MVICSRPECQSTAGCQCKERERVLRRMRENHDASPGIGWYCGNCLNWHGPHIGTCPAPPRDPRTLGERIRSANNG
jgi:hypothetical protein